MQREYVCNIKNWSNIIRHKNEKKHNSGGDESLSRRNGPQHRQVRMHWAEDRTFPYGSARFRSKQSLRLVPTRGEWDEFFGVAD